MKLKDLLEHCQIKAGKKFRLKDHDPSWAGEKDVPKSERKEFAENALSEDVTSLWPKPKICSTPPTPGRS